MNSPSLNVRALKSGKGFEFKVTLNFKWKLKIPFKSPVWYTILSFMVWLIYISSLE